MGYAVRKDGLGWRAVDLLEGKADLLEGETFSTTIPVIQEQQEEEEKLKSDVKTAIQNMLDTKAKEYEYDDILSVASYKSPTPLENPLDEKFRLQGNAFYDWRSACWRTSIAYMTEVKDAIALAKEKNEEYTLPTVEDVLAKMPTLDL